MFITSKMIRLAVDSVIIFDEWEPVVVYKKKKRNK